MSLTYRRAQQVDQVAQATEDVVTQLNAIPLIDGSLIQDITIGKIAPELNQVRHRLGRRARGAIVVKQSQAADIAVLPSSNSSEITLSTTAKVTVSLWVF